MKKTLLSALVLIGGVSALAQTPIQIGPTSPTVPSSSPVPLIVAFGEDTTTPSNVTSIPGYSANTFVGDSDMLSRVVGGETITITFTTPQNVSNIALYAASQQGGNILIHSVTAESAADGSSVPLTQLYTPSAVVAGDMKNDNGVVELLSGGYVSMPIQLTGGMLFNSITLQVESDLVNDNTLYVVVNSDQSLAPGSYSISRPNPGVDTSTQPTQPSGPPFPGHGWGHGWGHQPPPPVFDCRRFPNNPRCHHGGWGGPGGHPHP